VVFAKDLIMLLDFHLVVNKVKSNSHIEGGIQIIRHILRVGFKKKIGLVSKNLNHHKSANNSKFTMAIA